MNCDISNTSLKGHRRKVWNIESLQLLQYVLGTKADGSPDFEEATLDFASEEICERVMKEKEERGANEVVAFLTSSSGKPDVAGMRGKVIEH